MNDGETINRTRKIIEMYLGLDSPDQTLIDNFQAWLISGRNCREKDIVLWQIFEQYVVADEPTPEEELKALDKVKNLIKRFGNEYS